MNKDVYLFDTTLRDGSQGFGVSFSVEDKLKIAKALDDFGMDYIEGGWPGSNPKDEEFFLMASKIKFKNAKLAAFGSTRHKAKKASDDSNLLSIVKSKVKTACIFGKSWDFHVEHALRTTKEENLKMINDSVTFLKSKGLEVIYDAEHFFDGFVNNKEYSLLTLESAILGGADFVTLCETNGGMLPHNISEIVSEVIKKFPKTKFGIHTHNDSGCAVANSLVAVKNGCSLVQGTINGLGERCGNANLCSIIPALELKMKYRCINEKRLVFLTELSRYIDEVANIVPNESQPYVGRNAFAHKAGIHVSAIERDSKTYEHISPLKIGNERRVLISELSGKSNMIFKAKELSLNLEKNPDDLKNIIELIKKYENDGYQFEDADGSFTLVVKKAIKKYNPFFELKNFRVSVKKDENGAMVSEATIKIKVKNIIEHTVAEGDGPVNALDNCLRKALEKFYPKIKNVSLRDFKVRVIDAGQGTAAKVRVFIESTDGKKSWGTIGVSENIIDASWKALVDAVEYKLLSV